MSKRSKTSENLETLQKQLDKLQDIKAKRDLSEAQLDEDFEEFNEKAEEALNSALNDASLSLHKVKLHTGSPLQFPFTDVRKDNKTYTATQTSSAYMSGVIDGLLLLMKDQEENVALRNKLSKNELRINDFSIEDELNRNQALYIIADALSGYGTIKRRTPLRKKEGPSGFQEISRLSPKQIQAKLNEYVLGQDHLTKSVATFLHYFALRTIRPDLNIPVRSLLIAGPSGSGKTEVWRAVKKIFDLDVMIFNGAMFSSEGFIGNQKMSDLFHMAKPGTIIVIDEFDKMCSPKPSARGGNPANEIQAELLKYLEGDRVTYSGKSLDTSSVGFVFCGAFQSIFDQRAKMESKGAGIGFLSQKDGNKIDALSISDQELIDFGVRNELLGRINSRCVTRHLEREDYYAIAMNENSNISSLIKVFNDLYHFDYHLSKEEMDKAIDVSMSTDTGVRGFMNILEESLMNLFFEIENVPAYSRGYEADGSWSSISM